VEYTLDDVILNHALYCEKQERNNGWCLKGRWIDQNNGRGTDCRPIRECLGNKQIMYVNMADLKTKKQ
jgi:hypothetical protein